MYEPPLHRQPDLAAIHALMRAHPLALLISAGAGGLIANPIPFHFDAEGSPQGTLRAHLARANPQAEDLRRADEALVVFQGPDHYVSPSWYATKRETHKVVPTWNYLIVQARGRPRLVEDAPWLTRQLEALTQAREAERATPWRIDDAPPDYIAQMMRAIVGLEIDISDLRGKWKASQNRNEADREGVIAGLQAEGGEAAEAMARVVGGEGF